MSIEIIRLHRDAIFPQRQTEFSSGFDLHALGMLPPDEIHNIEKTLGYGEFVVYPGERILVRTGIAVQLPEGIEAQVRPRSGLALKEGITVLNSPGTIDADYAGEIRVILINLDYDPFRIRQGDRIAQLVFQPVLFNVEFTDHESLRKTQRGSGGFGHTGTEGSKAIA
ncbi:dUTP diphosphatase [Heliobacterium chlorum]|uniref:Deoxyuridine 5'-triphosphate nucleotidohydrolase n=1 Tax=Heliobacterium chlorum TaxID=2698 RepID=A0ABR7T6X3_HELCL|nr:dUTP diphosphatase [Heliobacterium chlorum]MBC9786513.1 dUTP diphosphatase [Heliobacterium chlorum]